MRISDWSSDVCSSDLSPFDGRHVGEVEWVGPGAIETLLAHARAGAALGRAMPRHRRADILAAAADSVDARAESFALDRESVVSGKSVSGRVGLCGRRIN